MLSTGLHFAPESTDGGGERRGEKRNPGVHGSSLRLFKPIEAMLMSIGTSWLRSRPGGVSDFAQKNHETTIRPFAKLPRFAPVLSKHAYPRGS